MVGGVVGVDGGLHGRMGDRLRDDRPGLGEPLHQDEFGVSCTLANLEGLLVLG
jgi:hypothetical protein